MFWPTFLSSRELPEIVWPHRVWKWTENWKNPEFDHSSYVVCSTTVVVNHGQIGHIWGKIMLNLEFLILKVRFQIRWNLAISKSFHGLKNVRWNMFYSRFSSWKQPWNQGRIHKRHHNIFELGIVWILSFVFESVEIRRFQGASMRPKTSVKTFSTVDLPLKRGIFRSKKLIKVKEKS